MQILRIDGIAKAATVLKLLPHDTPSLPSSVKGIVRARGFLTATQIIKIFYGSPTPAILSYTDADSWEDIESWDA